uniref:Uncharacterized protein n=1 Tax=Geospiza parvula TaxID=87175 RepID=A0A8U8BC47_GEOPR
MKNPQKSPQNPKKSPEKIPQKIQKKFLKSPNPPNNFWGPPNNFWGPPNKFLGPPQIDDSLASLVIAQLLFLQSESNKKPIHMYINSPGGPLPKLPAPPGQGQATDIAIQAEEILQLKRQINGLYAKHTGQPLAVIEAAMERDRYLSPVEAQEFGLLDQVLVHPPPRGEDEPGWCTRSPPRAPRGPPKTQPSPETPPQKSVLLCGNKGCGKPGGIWDFLGDFLFFFFFFYFFFGDFFYCLGGFFGGGVGNFLIFWWIFWVFLGIFWGGGLEIFWDYFCGYFVDILWIFGVDFRGI